MTEPCPGACNAIGETDPVMGEPVWCRPDQARIRRQYCELDYAAALYITGADGYREPGTELGRSNGHAPSPSPAMDTIDELTRWVLSWHDAYRDLHPHWKTAEIRHGYLAAVRTEIIAWTAERMDGMLAAPFAADFGFEVSAWHRRLLAMGKTGTGRRHMPLPCPWCGAITLFRADGDDHVACANPGPPRCRCRLTMDDYHALVKHAAVPA